MSSSPCPSNNQGILQWTFMFGSVLALLLLPMINHITHLNNMIHASTDQKEKEMLHTRLEKFRLALVTILLAILCIIWLLPLQLIYPETTLTFPIFIATCILVTVSMVIFVMDASKSIYIPPQTVSWTDPLLSEIS